MLVVVVVSEKLTSERAHELKSERAAGDGASHSSTRLYKVQYGSDLLCNVQGCAKRRRDGACQPNLQLFQLFLALDKAPRLSFRIERILSDQSQICPNHMIRHSLTHHHHQK